MYGSHVSTPIAAMVIEVYLLSSEMRLTAIIRQVKAGQDFDQRRLSRAIVTYKGMDFASPQVHRHVT